MVVVYQFGDDVWILECAGCLVSAVDVALNQAFEVRGREAEALRDGRAEGIG